jgi:hypothetical protein
METGRLTVWPYVLGMVAWSETPYRGRAKRGKPAKMFERVIGIGSKPIGLGRRAGEPEGIRQTAAGLGCSAGTLQIVK